MDLKDHYDKAIFLENGYEQTIQKCEQFYELTYQRDQAFLTNMLKVMRKLEDTAGDIGGVSTVTTQRSSRPKRSAARTGAWPGPAEAPSILITGGYHTPNLKYLLKQQNISYIVLTPQILHETNQKRYEQLLLGQDVHKIRFQNPTLPITIPNHVDVLDLASAARLSVNDYGARLAGELSGEAQEAWRREITTKSAARLATNNNIPDVLSTPDKTRDFLKKIMGRDLEENQIYSDRKSTRLNSSH